MELLKKYSEEQIQSVNPLALALVGDSVFSLYIREYVLQNHNVKTHALTRLVNGYVNAGYQYKVYRKIESLLSEKEVSICHRARNSNIHSKAKNYSVTEYIYATAFEALLGYLYLTDNKNRLSEILKISVEL